MKLQLLQALLEALYPGTIERSIEVTDDLSANELPFLVMLVAYPISASRLT
jgi:hypothetical protein